MSDLQLTGTVTICAAEGEQKGPRKFEMDAYFGGPLRVGAVPLPVVVDLASLKGTDKARPVLKDHDHKIVVGHADRFANDGKRLTASGVMSGAGPATVEVLQAADNGFPWAVSIGASPGKLERIEAGKTVTVNSQTFQGPLLVARGAALKEISFVSIPADDQASARIAATAADSGDSMSFDKWLEGKGIAAGELTDAVRSTLQAAFDAEQSPPVKPPKVKTGTLDDVLAAERAKESRQQKIVDLTAKALQDNPGQLEIIEAMSRQAFAGDWDQDRFELELLRATRPQANGRMRSTGDEMKGDVLEAALCMSGGMETTKLEASFNEQTLDAAQKRFRHGIGLGELLLTFARRNGYDATSTRNLAPLLKAAFAEDRMITASGVSTLSLPLILANTANKFLRMGFDSVEQTWREIAAKRNVKDFKQITSYSLTGDFTYIEVAPGGELKHATVGEETYTNQAKTYGRMFGIDRRDIINDDLGALTQVPKRLGRGGALKFNEVFWSEFMDNSAFFTSGNANFNSGVTVGTNDSRLNIEGLTIAETSFMNQTDPDGKPLSVAPRILLVPNALTIAAGSLMLDAVIGNNVANAVFTTGNPFAGKFRAVSSSYLSNSSFTGYSTTAWYLLADPNDVPVIEVAFLNGVETPTVEQADADFQQLGIQMRGYHDFGVNLQEYRGGVKMKGAA